MECGTAMMENSSGERVSIRVGGVEVVRSMFARSYSRHGSQSYDTSAPAHRQANGDWQRTLTPVLFSGPLPSAIPSDSQSTSGPPQKVT